MKKICAFFKKLFCLTQEEVVMPEAPKEEPVITPVLEVVETEDPETVEVKVVEPVVEAKPKKKRGRPKKKKTEK